MYRKIIINCNNSTSSASEEIINLVWRIISEANPHELMMNSFALSDLQKMFETAQSSLKDITFIRFENISDFDVKLLESVNLPSIVSNQRIG